MAISEELYELLDKQDWEDIIIKLTAYSVWLRFLSPTEQEPEDIAMGAISKVYEGQRSWNPAEEPDLLRHLKSIVKSMVNNDTRSASSSRRVQVAEVNDFSPVSYDYIDEELYARHLNERILEDMSGDPELCLVYKALKDEYTPKEISDDYGLSISTVQNARKRLKRIATRIIASLERKKHGTEKL